MMRATRGPLADSVRHHVTLFNIGSVRRSLAWARWRSRLLIMMARRLGNRFESVVAASLLVVAAGASADSRTETRGLQRNAFGALAQLKNRALERARTPVPILRPAQAPAREPSRVSSAYVGRREGETLSSIVLESTAARYLGLYGAGRDPMPALTRAESPAP